MKIKMNKNTYYKSFKDDVSLKKEVINFISNSNADKIIYTGNPTEINYKVIKKILTKERLIDPEIIKNQFRNIIKKGKYLNCLIYKINKQVILNNK